MKNLLVLNKKTIAKLNESQLTAIKGGKNNGKAPANCTCKTCTVICNGQGATVIKANIR